MPDVAPTSQPPPRATTASTTQAPTTPATTTATSDPEADSMRPIVFSGPSGTGKSTLIHKLFARHPDLFGFSVSHTTRAPRQGEQDGVHYHFTTRAEFERLVAQDDFLEHARFGGNYYGSSRAAVEAVSRGQGKSIDGSAAPGRRVCIFDVEMEGVRQLKDHPDLQPRVCFIQPPSRAELERRLRSRGHDSEDSIRRRLEQAEREMEYCRSQSAAGDKVIVNDDLDTAFAELDAWVMKDLAGSAAAS